MEILVDIIKIIQIVLLIYFGGTTLYLFVFALAGSLSGPAKNLTTDRYRHITVVIPAFMEDPVILEVIRSALEQDYPSDRFNILLVADTFQQDTLEKLRGFPIKLVEVNFENSTKAKSLQLSLEHLSPETEVILILDADNLMEDHFLQKINAAAESGAVVIQCHRIAKNTNTSFALLDAVSEEINNNIFRNGHRALGLSSALIGSAMVFDVKLFRKYIPKLNAVGGFDKELELMLLHDNIRIEYLNNAFVLDEKVQNAHVFYKQRKRWISSQIYFFGRDFLKSVYHLFRHRNLDYFDKTLQFSLPPRILLLGIVVLIGALNLIIPDMPFFYCWAGILSLILITLIISIPRRFFNSKTLKALISLPGIFLLMILITLRVKGGNKTFIHTEHSYHEHNR